MRASMLRWLNMRAAADAKLRISHTQLVFLGGIQDHRIIRSGSTKTQSYKCVNFHSLLHYVITID